jgi:hypothetical protein
VRLWTVHPQYLDAKGLTAAWREALLAQKVLSGATAGYRFHPQLIRFRSHPQPLQAVGAFLASLADEAKHRDYRFDKTKILYPSIAEEIEETEEQLIFEWAHLLQKLQKRAPILHRRHYEIIKPESHPLFRIVPGEIRKWEKR